MTEREQLDQLAQLAAAVQPQPKADPQAEAIRALLTAAWPYLWTYLPVLLPMLLNVLASGLAPKPVAKAAETGAQRFVMSPTTLPGVVGMILSLFFWNKGYMPTDWFTAAATASGAALAPTMKKQ